MFLIFFLFFFKFLVHFESQISAKTCSSEEMTILFQQLFNHYEMIMFHQNMSKMDQDMAKILSTNHNRINGLLGPDPPKMKKIKK